MGKRRKTRPVRRRKRAAGKHQRLPLTVCLIARNEEERIGGALDSVSPVAGEIIVVDTGSHDATRAIAAERGASVIDAPWCDNFSWTRNRAIEEASSEWILMIDADESLAPGQEKKLARLLSGDDKDAWFVQIRSPLAGRQSGQVFVHALPRLFRNRVDFRFRGRVHEQIHESLFEANARIGQSDLLLDHSGYALSREVRRGKLNRNRELLQLDLEDDPASALTWYHMGETCSLLDSQEEACRAYQKAIDLDTLPREHLAFARQNRAAALLKLARFEEAVQYASDAIETDRNALPALLIRASALMRLGAPREALVDLDQYMKRETDSFPDRSRLLRFEPDIPRARFLRAECFYRLGRGEESFDDARFVASERPEWAAPLRVLARAALATERLQEARDALRSLVRLEEGNPLIWKELAQVEMRLEGPGKALAIIEKALIAAPCAALYSTKGGLLLQGGDMADATASYAEAIRLDPATADNYRVMAHLLNQLGRKSEAADYLSQYRTIEQRSARSSPSSAAAPERSPAR